MTISLRKSVLLFVALCGALAAWVVAGSTMGQTTAHAVATTTVHVKQASLTDNTCGDQQITGAHFVINQISSPPASITVYFSDGSSQDVSLSKQTLSTAHYTFSFDPSLTIVDATAAVPVGWTGQFVLSNYLCGGGGSSSPPPPSSPPAT